MMGGPAVLLGVVLVASTGVGAEGTGSSTPDPARSQGAPTHETKRPSGTDHARGEAPRKKDRDQELIDNLDRIEQLELLQNLELFDTAAPRKK